MRAPDLSVPLPLPMRSGWPREKHVLKHLYRPGERWDLIMRFPVDLQERAVAAGCLPECMVRLRKGSKRHEHLSPSCKQRVRDDHDAYYQPAYLYAAKNALATRHVGQLDTHTWAFVGDNGVLVFADDSKQRPLRVVSAYRPTLGRPETRTAEELREAAFQEWRDKTSLAGVPQPDDEEEP